MSILSISTIFAIIVVCALFIYPLRFSLRTKIILFIIAIIAPLKSYIYYVVGGTAYDPNIPYNLSFVFDIARTTMLFLTILVIVRLIINGISKLIKRNKSFNLIPVHSPFYSLILLVISFALGAYGTACAYSYPNTTNYQITMDRLDPRLDGMKVVLLSDIHISSPTDVNLIYRMVNNINAMNPDLILMAGDLIDGSVEMRKPITDLLFKLKAKYGVYIVTGNHEYYSGYTPWREYFEQGGLISLDNKVLALKDDKQKTLLNLGGITDPMAARYNLPTPDVDGVASALDNSAPSIVLSHRPDYAHKFNAEKNKVDLVLSGHTHGGLVVGMDKIVAKANGGFVSGYYDLGKTRLIVCNGTMLWMGFPLRLGVPSQIDVIYLKSKAKSKDAGTLTRAFDLKQQKTATTSIDVSDKAKAEHHDAAPKKPEQKLKGVELILPMTDTETGKVSESITRIAILPKNLTKDQLSRIQGIVNEALDAKPRIVVPTTASMTVVKGDQKWSEGKNNPSNQSGTVIYDIKQDGSIKSNAKVLTPLPAQKQEVKDVDTSGKVSDEDLDKALSSTDEESYVTDLLDKRDSAYEAQDMGKTKATDSTKFDGVLRNNGTEAATASNINLELKTIYSLSLGKSNGALPDDGSVESFLRPRH